MKNNSPESSAPDTKNPHGGKRSNAGRKKGVGNKLTEKLKAAALKKADTTPLEFMLKIMLKPEPILLPDESILGFARRHEFWAEQAFEAAKAAAPYVHAKLQNIEVSGKDGAAIKHDVTLTLDPDEAYMRMVRGK